MFHYSLNDIQMDLRFDPRLADAYTSASQKIRVLSEHWVSRRVYCPSCGHVAITQYRNNNPVADFFCSACEEDYELKSQQNKFVVKVVDGSYRTMIERLTAKRNPNLVLLNYDPRRLVVVNLFIVPKHFFVPKVIEERKPLSPLARRAGWVGCNILLQGIPKLGRIDLIKAGTIEPKDQVLLKWRQTLFLRYQKNLAAKGWLLAVIRCIERLRCPTFTIEELYRFEPELRLSHEPAHQGEDAPETADPAGPGLLGVRWQGSLSAD